MVSHRHTQTHRHTHGNRSENKALFVYGEDKESTEDAEMSRGMR